MIDLLVDAVLIRLVQILGIILTGETKFLNDPYLNSLPRETLFANLLLQLPDTPLGNQGRTGKINAQGIMGTVGADPLHHPVLQGVGEVLLNLQFWKQFKKSVTAHSSSLQCNNS